MIITKSKYAYRNVVRAISTGSGSEYTLSRISNLILILFNNNDVLIKVLPNFGSRNKIE